MLLKEYIFYFDYDTDGKVSMKISAEGKKAATVGSQVVNLSMTILLQVSDEPLWFLQAYWRS